MNRDQLRNCVVIPTLCMIPKGASGVSAAMLIAAHESLRGEYLKQKGGPALGIYGMEPPTYHDTWKHGDSIWDNALLCGYITQDDFDKKAYPFAEKMVGDLCFATFMCRQRLFMKPGALPEDLKELSAYLKFHWNSVLGAADEMSYYDDYILWK